MVMVCPGFPRRGERFHARRHRPHAHVLLGGLVVLGVRLVRLETSSRLASLAFWRVIRDRRAFAFHGDSRARVIRSSLRGAAVLARVRSVFEQAQRRRPRAPRRRADAWSRRVGRRAVMIDRSIDRTRLLVLSCRVSSCLIASRRSYPTELHVLDPAFFVVWAFVCIATTWNWETMLSQVETRKGGRGEGHPSRREEEGEEEEGAPSQSVPVRERERWGSVRPARSVGGVSAGSRRRRFAGGDRRTTSRRAALHPPLAHVAASRPPPFPSDGALTARRLPLSSSSRPQNFEANERSGRKFAKVSEEEMREKTILYRLASWPNLTQLLFLASPCFGGEAWMAVRRRVVVVVVVARRSVVCGLVAGAAAGASRAPSSGRSPFRHVAPPFDRTRAARRVSPHAASADRNALVVLTVQPPTLPLAERPFVSAATTRLDARAVAATATFDLDL